MNTVVEADCSPQNIHPRISKLETKQRVIDESNKIQILTIGEEIDRPIKSLVLIGETGSGKTTFLNAIINHLFGIEFDSDIRYQIEDATGNKMKDVTESQTEYVTGYLVYHDPRVMKHECNFLIIDTPGLADTRGAQQQAQVVQQIKHFLEEEKFGVNELHVIGFVMKASVNRKLGYMNTMNDEFHDLFGKDTTGITNILLTHDVTEKSRVLKILESMGLKAKNDYSFENGSLYAPNKQSECESLSKKDRRQFLVRKCVWENTAEEFECFCQDLIQTQPVSLTMTRDSIREKMYLERALFNLKNNIDACVNMLIEQQSQKELLKNYEENLEKNKNWTAKKKVIKKEKEELKSTSGHCHNCDKCLRTCVNPCDGGWFCGCPKEKDQCKICKCSNEDHTQEKYTFVEKFSEITVTDEDMKEKYGNASNKVKDIKEALKDLEQKNDDVCLSMAESIKKIILHTRKISKISRNTKELSAKQFVDNMVSEVEKSQKYEFSSQVTKQYICTVFNKLPKMVEEIDLDLHAEYEELDRNIQKANAATKIKQVFK
ncbi:uncharacterized protein [Procambarus clarkii]|uniref:uncharacterized protein n=1 Tax=Procambarus clarkii TaxID=6728 RepID=UPI001E6763E0|nr:uncharacterized protein LOC123762294 isoform X2 [Procambarus clarkii]